MDMTRFAYSPVHGWWFVFSPFFGCDQYFCFEHHTHVLVWTSVFVSSEYMPETRIAGSYVNTWFSHLRNCPFLFQSDCTLVHSDSSEDKVLFHYIFPMVAVICVLDYSHSGGLLREEVRFGGQEECWFSQLKPVSWENLDTYIHYLTL